MKGAPDTRCPTANLPAPAPFSATTPTPAGVRQSRGTDGHASLLSRQCGPRAAPLRFGSAVGKPGSAAGKKPVPGRQGAAEAARALQTFQSGHRREAGWVGSEARICRQHSTSQQAALPGNGAQERSKRSGRRHPNKPKRCSCVRHSGVPMAARDGESRALTDSHDGKHVGGVDGAQRQPHQHLALHQNEKVGAAARGGCRRRRGRGRSPGLGRGGALTPPSWCWWGCQCRSC